MHLPTRFDDDFLAATEARLRRLSRYQLPGDKRAAVTVPLCHVDGAPSVLFTKRTETVGTHKGHVSFPGGRVDDTDLGPDDTALRELCEETGIAREQVRVLGLFHDALAITGVAVTPLLVFLGDLDTRSLVLSEHEIDVAFTLTLRELADPSHRSAQTWGERQSPVFSAGPYPVWGLTAWILDEIMIEAMALPLEPMTRGLR